MCWKGELVEGIKAGEWSELSVWRVVKDVAAALSYVHALDYAHRDLKPQVLANFPCNQISNRQYFVFVEEFDACYRRRKNKNHVD